MFWIRYHIKKVNSVVFHRDNGLVTVVQPYGKCTQILAILDYTDSDRYIPLPDTGYTLRTSGITHIQPGNLKLIRNHCRLIKHERKRSFTAQWICRAPRGIRG